MDICSIINYSKCYRLYAQIDKVSQKKILNLHFNVIFYVALIDHLPVSLCYWVQTVQKAFNSIYFREHLRVTAAVFVSFSVILLKKSFLNDSPVFQKFKLQTQSLNCLAVTIAIIPMLSENIKISSMRSPAW